MATYGPVNIEGIEYKNPCDAARFLVNEKQMPIKEVATQLGIHESTVRAVTIYADKIKHRLLKKRAIKLAKSKKKLSISEISKKTGLKGVELKKIYKENNIVPKGEVVKYKILKRQNLKSSENTDALIRKIYNILEKASKTNKKSA